MLFRSRDQLKHQANVSAPLSRVLSVADSEAEELKRINKKNEIKAASEEKPSPKNEAPIQHPMVTSSPKSKDKRSKSKSPIRSEVRKDSKGYLLTVQYTFNCYEDANILLILFAFNFRRTNGFEWIS